MLTETDTWLSLHPELEPMYQSIVWRDGVLPIQLWYLEMTYVFGIRITLKDVKLFNNIKKTNVNVVL